jgi:hypothetical protein
MGDRLRRDEVAPAHLVGAEARIPRRGIDQPFDNIGRLGPSGAAVGVDEDRIGEYALDLDIGGGIAYRPVSIVLPARVTIIGAKFER